MTKLNPKVIRLIVAVRSAHRRAAEMEVSKAEMHLRQLDADRNKSLKILNGQVEAWSKSISGPSLGLDFARAWSNAVLQGEAALGRIDLQIQDADAARGQRVAELAAAVARADAAKQLDDKARRQARRRDEEQALADYTDRFLHLNRR